MSSLDQLVEAIAERIFELRFSEWSTKLVMSDIPEDARDLRNRLARINARERISIGEAALLLNCSDGHVRNLIKKAKNRQTKNPIPFSDLDGVTVFNRLALLAWADDPKHELRTVTTKERIVE